MEKSSEEENDEKIQRDKITYMGTILYHHNPYDNYHCAKVTTWHLECSVQQYHVLLRTNRIFLK